MADVEIERKRVTLHPLDENGVVDTTVNLYPKTFKDGIVDRDGNPVNVLTDADIGHIQEEIEQLSTNKQDTLVSRRNIKSINNQDILGEGNLEVGGKEPLYIEGEIEDLTSEQVESLRIGDQVVVYTSDLYTVQYADSGSKYLVYVDETFILSVSFDRENEGWVYAGKYQVPVGILTSGYDDQEDGKVLTTAGTGLMWKNPKLKVDDIEALTDIQCTTLQPGDVIIEEAKANVLYNVYIVADKMTVGKNGMKTLYLNSVNRTTIRYVYYKKPNSSSPWGYEDTFSYNLKTDFPHKYTTSDDMNSLNSDFVNQLEIGDIVLCANEFKGYIVTYKEGSELYLVFTDESEIDSYYYADGNYSGHYTVPIHVLTDSSSAVVGSVLTVDSNGEPSWQSASTDEPEKITWANLKTKRDNSQLVVGKKYRITNYVNSIANTNNTQSVDYIQFDIIVTAIRTNALSEFASACERENAYNTYSIRYDKWELKYCLDNDTNRFLWADTTNGKGVIYYMKDEWGNECPYDFKNTRFYYTSPYGGIGSLYVYTFSNLYYNKGAHLYELSVQGKCKNCVIKDYFDTSAWARYIIPFGNLFISYCDHVSSVKYALFEDNVIGHGSYSNQFIGTWEGTIKGNKLGYSCRDNYIESSYNIFEDYCNHIDVIADEEALGRNTFGTHCSNITTSNNPQYDNFGFHDNVFGDYCTSISLNGSCNFNVFGKRCSNISTNYYTFVYNARIGNYCRYINFNVVIGNDGGTFIESLIMDNNCKYLTITGLNQASYSDEAYVDSTVHFHSDIQGTSSSYKEIALNLELDHPVDYYANNQEDIIV